MKIFYADANARITQNRGFDGRTSIHVKIDRTGLRPDKVHGLVADPSEPDLRQSPIGSMSVTPAAKTALENKAQTASS